jgi:hypothetical protein
LFKLFFLFPKLKLYLKCLFQGLLKISSSNSECFREFNTIERITLSRDLA